MITSGSKIAALIVTYRRPALLARLMKSLVESDLPPDLVLVWDNGGEPATAEVAARYGALARYVASPGNLGVGGGIAAGIECLRKDGWENYQFLWLLDDDAEVHPECLEALVAAARTTRAALHVPLIEDEEGRLAWLPGIRHRPMAAMAKKGATAAGVQKQFSTAPMAIDWATGVSQLVTMRAIERWGGPRTDFLMLGEDIEFSSRLCREGGGFVVPGAVVCHLPPPAVSSGDGFDVGHYVKFNALLQNLAYITFHCPRSLGFSRSLAADSLRMLRVFGVAPQVWMDLIACWFRGGLLGQPAGTAGFSRWRQRMLERP